MGAVQQRRVTAPWVAAAVALLAVLALWSAWGSGSGATRVVEGWAMPNEAGTAVSLHDAQDGDRGTGYVVAGAMWKDAEGVWSDGADLPTCIGTDTGSLTHVRMGLVTVSTPEGTTWDQVTWPECLP
jgi:hypothetical protein